MNVGKNHAIHPVLVLYGTRFAGSRVKKMFQSDENPDPMPIDPSYRTARIYDGITLDENPTRLAEVPDESEVK